MSEHNLDKHKWQSHKCAQLRTGVTSKANTAGRLYVTRAYQPHTLVCRLLLGFLFEQVCLFGRTAAFYLECPRFSPWSDWRNTLAVFMKFFSLIDRRALYILCILEAHV
jgi:hypothetical protein